jgi:hypothetical protein
MVAARTRAAHAPPKAPQEYKSPNREVKRGQPEADWPCQAHFRDHVAEETREAHKPRETHATRAAIAHEAFAPSDHETLELAAM